MFLLQKTYLVVLQLDHFTITCGTYLFSYARRYVHGPKVRIKVPSEVRYNSSDMQNTRPIRIYLPILSRF